MVQKALSLNKIILIDFFVLLFGCSAPNTEKPNNIFEKIDEERAQVLTQIIKNDNFGQIFITDTNEHRLTAFCEAIGKPYTTLLLA